MTTVIGVMDRDFGDPNQNTDVNVVVDPGRKALTWVPRDMFCKCLNNRVNSVFRIGCGHAKYRQAVAEHYGDSIHASVVVWPKAIELAVDGLSVTVPVKASMKFRYPLAPDREIQKGEKVIEFHPPCETLSGERIHQWCGARYGIPGLVFTDLDRIRRQMVLVATLMESRFDFSKVMSSGERPGIIEFSPDREGALVDIGQISRGWRFSLIEDVVPTKIRGMSVLLRREVAPGLK